MHMVLLRWEQILGPIRLCWAKKKIQNRPKCTGRHGLLLDQIGRSDFHQFSANFDRNSELCSVSSQRATPIGILRSCIRGWAWLAYGVAGRPKILLGLGKFTWAKGKPNFASTVGSAPGQNLRVSSNISIAQKILDFSSKKSRSKYDWIYKCWLSIISLYCQVLNRLLYFYVVEHPFHGSLLNRLLWPYPLIILKSLLYMRHRPHITIMWYWFCRNSYHYHLWR